MILRKKSSKSTIKQDKKIDDPVPVIYGPTYSRVDQVKFVEDSL